MQHIVIDPGGALPSALQAFLVPDDPRAIAQAIEALIERLDAADGDPDAEPDFSEDDAVLPPWWGASYRGDGAGCPIGDPDFEHDGREEEHEGDPLDLGEGGDCHGQFC